MFRAVVVLLLFIGSSDTFAMLVMHDADVDCTSELTNWRSGVEEMGRHMIKSGEYFKTNGFFSCRRTLQLPNVMLCMSLFQTDMNRMFGRASIFAEGGYELPKGSLAPHDHFDMQRLNLTTQGHDLKASDLEAFFAHVDRECAIKKELCLNPFEIDLKEKVFDRMMERYRDFVILGFSVQSFSTHQSTVGHEIMHAQYFVDPVYRGAVDLFWRLQVPERDKIAIRKILAAEAYDPNDEDLMKNEFQAFVLEPDGERDRLGEFSVKYREALTAALAVVRKAPILIQ